VLKQNLNPFKERIRQLILALNERISFLGRHSKYKSMKSNLSIVSVFLLTIQALYCSGQTNSRYTQSPTSHFNIIKANGGGYYALSTNDSTNLIRLTEDLNVIWTKKLNTTPKYINSNLYQGESTNLYVWGDSLSVVQHGFPVGGSYFKLDSAGNILHFTSFDRGIFAQNFIEHSADELLISGLHIVGNGSIDIDFLKYDSSGTKIFCKERGFTTYSRFSVNFLKTTNNLYRLGVEPDGADGFMAIYEFDQIDERWNKFKTFQFSTGVLTGTNLIELPNGNYFFSNCGYDFPNSSSNYFCIMDTGFNILRQRSYQFNYIPNTTSNDLRISMQAMSTDSQIVIFGKTSSNPSSLCLFKLDLNLDIIWSNSFEGGPDSWPNAILNTSDGGFLLSYTKSNSNYLIKSDSIGQINCMQQFPINISTSSLLPNVYDINFITDNVNANYPPDTMTYTIDSSYFFLDDFCNLVDVEKPISEQSYSISIKNNLLQVKINDESLTIKQVQLFNLYGQVLFNEKFNGFYYNKIIPEIKTGIYIIRIKNGGEIFTKKIFINFE